jgi:hypothetical protein
VAALSTHEWVCAPVVFLNRFSIVRPGRAGENAELRPRPGQAAKQMMPEDSLSCLTPGPLSLPECSSDLPAVRRRLGHE